LSSEYVSTKLEVFVAERQSARMSKITNDGGLTQSDTAQDAL